MTKIINKKTREKIAEFLPEAVSKTLCSYEEFMQKNSNVEAKEFSAHHTACKAAISHLELLLKLAKWAKIPDSEKKSDDLQAMLKQAQERVDQHKNNMKPKS